MSVLDPLRIHFRGTGFVNRPTQCRNRNGEIDFPTNTVFVDGEPVLDGAPPSLYHEHLAATGRRYGADGVPDEKGLFSENVGWNAGGNQHFIWIDTRVSSVQTAHGRLDLTQDALIGSMVEIWGHYNEYLRTTANRARFIDLDPTSRWTPHVVLGHFTFGRRGPSIESPNLFSADVDGSHGARWVRSNALIGWEDHVEHGDLTTAMTFHFVIPKLAADALPGKHFSWHERAVESDVLRAFQRALEEDDAVGLAVQYTLRCMAPPRQHESPALYELIGTIGVARAADSRTNPPGRLLAPHRCPRSPELRNQFGPASVCVKDGMATFNLPATIPWILDRSRSSSSPAPTSTLELCLGQSGTRIAILDAKHHEPDSLARGGITDVPVEPAWSAELEAVIAAEGLLLRDAGSGEIKLREREVLLDADVVNLYLDHPDRRRGQDHSRSVRLRSFVRGRPTAAGPIRLHNVINPAFHARQFRDALEREASGGELLVAEPCTPEGQPAPTTLHTGEDGLATLTLRGKRPGAARLWLETPEDEGIASRPTDAETLAARYDDADTTLFWSTANVLNVRVLADDWKLLDIHPAQVDYKYLYRHGLMTYELLYPFMAMSVFSLADEPKFETYARLMYQMCDARNRERTYYMPSTRDLTPAQTELMFIYMGNVAEQNAGVFDSSPAVQLEEPTRLSNAEAREEAVSLLRLAIDIEMSLMLQYLYAGYSVPNQKTGRELVRSGTWTSEQLRLACGDGTERPRQGFRGTLLEIAHEEMIHFHVVENLLLAVGEPFYVPNIDWPKAGARFPLGAETSLEPFSLTALTRFVHFERPASLNLVTAASHPARVGHGALQFRSVSELYARIRCLVEEYPNIIRREEWRPLWREHHLFLSERLDRRHPDFQMQVWNPESALLALDFIVSQGEGRSDLANDAEDAHYHRFRRMTIELAEQMGETTANGGPWNPAYPALKNPTLSNDVPGWQEIVEPSARAIAEINEECFALMLLLMARHHVDIPSMSLRRSRLMNSSIDVMTGMVRPLSIQLMAMPSGIHGFTAGPTFRVPGSLQLLSTMNTREALMEFSRIFGKLHRKASQVAAMRRAPLGMMAFYEHYFQELATRKILSMTTE